MSKEITVFISSPDEIAPVRKLALGIVKKMAQGEASRQGVLLKAYDRDSIPPVAVNRFRIRGTGSELREQLLTPDGCETCTHRRACRGGLRCLSYAVTGDPLGADPACWHRRTPA